MILQALYRYYEILLKDPDVDIAIPGYSAANVNFALNLSQDGELLDILPLVQKVQQGNKTKEIAQRVIVPEQIKRSGTKPVANFLCDNAAYVLGISKNSESDPNYSLQRFEVFKSFNVGLLEKATSKAAIAIVNFLNSHDPRQAQNNPLIASKYEELMAGGNLIFWVEGKPALEDVEISNIWGERIASSDSVKMQCLVTGENEPIARLHPSIKGVRFAQSSGASLVSFNERAYESYNRMKGQGLNSPVSQRVVSGYGVALNYLLSGQNPNRKIVLGDTSIVYWAESENKGYANAISALLNPDYLDDEEKESQTERKAAEELLGNTIEKVRKIQALDVNSLTRGLDKDTRFYILGIAPNAARLAIRFFLTDPFEKFVQRIMLHYEDLKINKEYPDQPDYISISKILRECVSPKVTRRDDELAKSWSLLSGSFTRAILNGEPYPEELFFAILNRIRIDSDEGNTKKINYIRAAVIKAHLIRKYRRQGHNPYQEVLQMSLNPQYSHPAYVLGRLFAVLEKVQREAIGEVNASIKDRYFASACATPASVFPVLLRLSQHHTAKAEHGKASDFRIEELLNLLDVTQNPFPARLTLDEQGVFVLGYYHQRAAFFVKTNTNPSEIKSA